MDLIESDLKDKLGVFLKTTLALVERQLSSAFHFLHLFVFCLICVKNILFLQKFYLRDKILREATIETWFPLENWKISQMQSVICQIFVITNQIFVTKCQISVIKWQIFVIKCQIIVIKCKLFFMLCQILSFLPSSARNYGQVLKAPDFGEALGCWKGKGWSAIECLAILGKSSRVEWTFMKDYMSLTNRGLIFRKFFIFFLPILKDLYSLLSTRS